MSREELIPRSVRKLPVGATAASNGKLPAPPPLLSTQSISWTTFTQRARASVFFFFINPKSHAYVFKHQKKHCFHSDGTCGAPPSLNHHADPVTTKPYGTRLYYPFKRMDSYTLNQPHECSSDHAAPLPEMRSQRLTASTHPLYGAAHSFNCIDCTVILYTVTVLKILVNNYPSVT